MAFDWGTAIGAGLSFVGGLLDDDLDKQLKQSGTNAAFGARYAYPGQKDLGGKVSKYLWENLNMGLTEDEKRLMRGAGRTGILQGAQSAAAGATRKAASQGLRGGNIANILANINEAKIPAFGKLETNIAVTDANLRRKRIADILTFLGLSAGYGEGSSSASGGGSSGGNTSTYGAGGAGEYKSGYGTGGGNAPPTSSAGYNISNDTIASIVGSLPFGLPVAAMQQADAFTNQGGKIGDMTESGYANPNANQGLSISDALGLLGFSTQGDYGGGGSGMGPAGAGQGAMGIGGIGSTGDAW